MAESPVFLSVQLSDIVIIQEASLASESGEADWWMGFVISIQGGARNSFQNSLLQIADIDTGDVKWVNADLVTLILA